MTNSNSILAIDLNNISTRAPEEFSKKETKAELDTIVKELQELQNLMYAENKRSLLVILQGMDASGKDGIVNDVFSSMNPQGVNVTSFKVPSDVEAAHDFLWRIHMHAPAKGMVQIFNRSHYEDILVTRVHNIIDDVEAERRMISINNFERHLTANNTHILKFYLHVSKEEQLERIKERMTDPEKMWKYNGKDIKEISQRDVYIKYYQEVFANCNYIPWHILPADQNWYKSYIVAKTIRDTLMGLNMQYPQLKK